MQIFSNTITPEIGMGATICVGSDRYAGTIVNVNKTGKTIHFQYDDSYVVFGNIYSGDVRYTYTRNPHASIVVFTLRKNGRYKEKGASMNSGRSLIVGIRDEYCDPHI